MKLREILKELLTKYYKHLSNFFFRVLEMVKAIWNNKIIAETDDFEIVEGNYYFPPESVNRKYLKESKKHTTCPIKGIASYYDVVVDGEINKDAAWYYPDPKPVVKKIKKYVAFWNGVEIKN